MKLKLPEKVVRAAVKRNFDKVDLKTWDYLFDYEKENGLSQCRVEPEWGIRRAWYSIAAVKVWLIDRGYYTLTDFDDDGWPIPTRREIPRGLNVTTHILA